MSLPPDPPASRATSWSARVRRAIAPASDDLLRDAAYRRLFASILISAIGGQISMLALPLTAATLLSATPTQMGVLTMCETLPFVVLALPTGVWLDRVRKLPIYVVGELVLATSLLSVTLAAWRGWLAMPWLYVVALSIGAVQAVSGSAAQIVLTHVVPRARLIDAHAKNALANSAAEVAGPGLAGALLRAVGAPIALVVNAALLLGSALVLQGLPVREEPAPRDARDARGSFVRELREGLSFVVRTPLLVAMAVAVGVWQLCNNAAMSVQILHATRTLGLNEHEVGMSYVALGVGTVLSSSLGGRVSRHIGPGPALLLGFATTGIGWIVGALAPTGPAGVVGFAFMLFCFGTGTVLLFVNFLGMRQAVTPAPLLGRMTSSMRWLILLPAGPGALLGGRIGDLFGLRTTLLGAGLGALSLALVASSSWSRLRTVRHLPQPAPHDAAAYNAQ